MAGRAGPGDRAGTEAAGQQHAAPPAGDGQGQAAEGRPSLTLKRRLKAPAIKVYEAWTRPEQLARWFGPLSTEVQSAEADVRVGGRFRVAMLETSGAREGEHHEVGGVYRAVEPASRLVFTWAWISTPERESLVTVTFRPAPGAEASETILTLLHERLFDQAARDGHAHGWGEALQRLEAFVA